VSLRRTREKLVGISGGASLGKAIVDFRPMFSRDGVNFHMVLVLFEEAAEEVHFLRFYYKLYQEVSEFTEKCIDTVDPHIQNTPLPH
jgi:hypothetical protein